MALAVLRRLAVATVTIAALLTAVFALVHLAPGDPVDLVVDPDLDDPGRERLRTSLGLDRPWLERYLDWMGGFVTGDLGRSIATHRPVAEIIGEALPRTLLLTVSAYVVHLAAALVLGVIMAVRAGSRTARALDVAGLAVYSLPSFWLSLMLILIFARILGWLPAGGMRDVGAALGEPWGWHDVLRHLVLPVTVLGLASAMGTARYLRASLEENLSQGYVTAARARGLPEHRVVAHALRNAMLPMVTLVGLDVAFLVGGAVVVETVFAWPGMGRVTVEAIFARDYPVVMATTALAGVMVIVGNAAADLCYGLVDPRVRVEGGDAP